MANLTTAVSVQIDKEKVTEILQKLGVSMSGLIKRRKWTISLLYGKRFSKSRKRTYLYKKIPWRI